MGFLENLNSLFNFPSPKPFSYFNKKQGPVLNQINSMAEKNAGAPSKGKGGKRR